MATRRSPRKKPAQTRSKQTVDALVTAAARILERDGYARANVNRIAAKAGVSVGSLYQYFPTKEALAAAVARKLSDDMLAVFRDGLAETALLPFEETIRAVAMRTVRAFRVNPRLRDVITSELPENALASTDFDRELAKAIEAYLAFHRDRVRPTNLALAVAIVMAAVEGAAKAAALRGDADEIVADELTHLIAGYLRR
jgi:AcrR family transcriptional regulator